MVEAREVQQEVRRGQSVFGCVEAACQRKRARGLIPRPHNVHEPWPFSMNSLTYERNPDERILVPRESSTHGKESPGATTYRWNKGKTELVVRAVCRLYNVGGGAPVKFDRRRRATGPKQPLYASAFGEIASLQPYKILRNARPTEKVCKHYNSI